MDTCTVSQDIHIDTYKVSQDIHINVQGSNQPNLSSEHCHQLGIVIMLIELELLCNDLT